MSRTTIQQEFKLGHPSNRLLTFKKHKWVFGEDVRCSPTALSHAGFYAIASECAVCYFCGKELEGWCANDEPWEEHKMHCPECPFVKYYSSPPTAILVIDSLKLEKERLLYIVRNEHEKTMAVIESVNKKPRGTVGRKRK